MVPLGEVVKWGSGGTPSRGVPTYFNGDIPWVSISDLNDGIVSRTREFLTEEGVANSSAKIVPSGAIMVAMYGSIGKLGITGSQMATSQAIAFAIPDQDRVHSRYLYHYLRSQRKALLGRGRGGTQQNIGQKDLRDLQFPSTCLAEQRRIAAILDQADALRAKRRELLGEVVRLEQALFREIFSEAETIPLGKVASFHSGGTPSKERAEYWSGDVPWFSPKDLKRNSLNDSIDHISSTAVVESGLRIFPAKSVAVVVRGMILAHTLPVSLLEEPATINQDLKVLEPRAEMNEEFLAAAVRDRSQWVLSQVATSAHGTKRVETSLLERIPMPNVSKAAQDEFARRVNAAQRLHRGHSISHYDELFTSLQSRAFRGEL